MITRTILFVAALAVASPAGADAIARQGADWVRMTALPCKQESVIAQIELQGEDPKDFRAASAELNGHLFSACARPLWERGVILIRYEDGDAGLVPFGEFKPVPEA
jgi:hypothetical protein